MADDKKEKKNLNAEELENVSGGSFVDDVIEFAEEVIDGVKKTVGHPN